MDYTAVQIERRNHIAWLTLNRPESLNAMNRALVQELRLVIEEATFHLAHPLGPQGARQSHEVADAEMRVPTADQVQIASQCFTYRAHGHQTRAKHVIGPQHIQRHGRRGNLGDGRRHEGDRPVVAGQNL